MTLRIRCHATRIALALSAAVFAGCASARAPEFLTTTVGPPRPFSPAVRVNGFLYLSGQVGTDSTGKLVTGGIQAETRQTMLNIGAVLQRSGSSFDRVVKCTVFLADMSEWSAMNDVYVTFFPADRRPARSALGANGLALGSKVEIECIAV
jgi:2-iminobutanoate/2-iminopropanoate deaminase